MNTSSPLFSPTEFRLTDIRKHLKVAKTRKQLPGRKVYTWVLESAVERKAIKVANMPYLDHLTLRTANMAGLIRLHIRGTDLPNATLFYTVIYEGIDPVGMSF